jgi:hypothetical protein
MGHRTSPPTKAYGTDISLTIRIFIEVCHIVVWCDSAP